MFGRIWPWWPKLRIRTTGGAPVARNGPDVTLVTLKPSLTSSRSLATRDALSSRLEILAAVPVSSALLVLL